MTKQTEALKLALEALKGGLWDYGPEQDEHERCGEIIAICEEALAQSEQDPVCEKDPQGCWNVRCQLGKKCKNTPLQRTWIGLTKKEFQEAVEGLEDLEDCWVAIEAKLKEKNT